MHVPFPACADLASGFLQECICNLNLLMSIHHSSMMAWLLFTTSGARIAGTFTVTFRHNDMYISIALALEFRACWPELGRRGLSLGARHFCSEISCSGFGSGFGYAAKTKEEQRDNKL